MKKEKGITLVSLVLYVIVMAIVIVVMSEIINNFYNNTTTVQGNVQEIVEFSKFNNYFLSEVKTNNNKVDSVSTNYILFSSGNSFSLSNNVIYYNNKRVCEGVTNMQIQLGRDGDGLDETIINVTLEFNNYKKSINYKLENIY